MSDQSPTNERLKAPEMVYISGEEMTHEVMKLVLAKWISPYLDTAKWQRFDLSCKSRDATDDKVLKDAIAAGASVGAIFKEPTITATAEQAKAMGLKKPQGSPNGKMREGWNGYSIDRDTIAVPGLPNMGYENPVLFCRHAVGGEYGAGYKILGAGTVRTIHTDAAGKETVVDERKLKDEKNAIVTYHNALDNVQDLANHFFKRALAAGKTPYVVTKKTVFKWQEPFWQTMKEVFDRDYKKEFLEAGLLDYTGKELRHLLSDDAAMKVAKWRKGNFAMVAHNYDGDWLTDEVAEIYKSPAFMSSALIGVRSDGKKIMEFEASHGTVADQHPEFLAGRRTSVNPLGLVYALRGAMDHSVWLALESAHMSKSDAEQVFLFTRSMYDSMAAALLDAKATDDIVGPGKGLSTQDFIDEVAGRIEKAFKPSGGKRKIA